MDTTLFMIALVAFAALYIGIGVFLLWSLLITMMVILAYLAARYGHVVENYPYNVSETLTSILLIATTWVVFIIVGPKPFTVAGSTEIYTTLAEDIFSSIAAVVIVFAFVVFIILAVLVPHFERRGGMGAGGSGGGEGGNLTVGA
ncbi:MAG: hypothetical protein M1144_06630 [Candidatus Thermoplasmatota archaeon]|nr:hypothetical protein [Candidatus Thermoplasmatota archaeon]